MAIGPTGPAGGLAGLLAVLFGVSLFCGLLTSPAQVPAEGAPCLAPSPCAVCPLPEVPVWSWAALAALAVAALVALYGLYCLVQTVLVWLGIGVGIGAGLSLAAQLSASPSPREPDSDLIGLLDPYTPEHDGFDGGRAHPHPLEGW